MRPGAILSTSLAHGGPSSQTACLSRPACWAVLPRPLGGTYPFWDPDTGLFPGSSLNGKIQRRCCLGDSEQFLGLGFGNLLLTFRRLGPLDQCGQSVFLASSFLRGDEGPWQTSSLGV